MRSWIDYWNTDTPIYVNARHRLLHYQGIAQDLRRLLRDDDKTVLDFGCGEALSAATVAEGCTTLYLCDAAPNVRAKLTQQFSENPKIRIASPDEIAALPDGSFNLIIANSVLQYIGLEALKALLITWHAKLSPQGRLILADVIARESGALKDVEALLKFGLRGGFLLAAFMGLIRTLLSDYRRLRADLGLSTYGEAEMLDLLAAHGFMAKRMAENIGHNPARMSFEAVLA